MRLAFFGDVVGKSGRDGLSDHLPGLRRDLRLDFVDPEPKKQTLDLSSLLCLT